MKRIAALLMFCALSVNAAQLSGKWTGRADAGNRKGGPFVLVLKQAGGALTGTVTLRPDRQNPIRNGRVAGQKITFEVAFSSDSGLESVCAYSLTLAGEVIEGEGEIPNEHGTRMPVKLSLKRVPPAK